jgi:8-oxo-dGTP diphosphatase
MADERFFFVKLAAGASLSRDGWTAQEVEVMADHRWWSLDEPAQTPATVWPENLLAMLNAAKSR